MIKCFAIAAVAATLAASSGVASATPLTSISPTGFDVTTVGASTVGGIVVQLVGTNGTRVISQLAASTLFVGSPPASANPLLIGQQSGFNTAITGALGGGLASAAFRFSLYDGDFGAGDFDHNDATLLVNGISIGNWSAVATQNTDGLGVAAAAGVSTGFRNNLLDTGWFTLTESGKLTALFSSLLLTERAVFKLDDVDPGDQFYDFTRGIDKSLLNVGSGPVITPPSGSVPEPASFALAAVALMAAFWARRRVRL